MIYRIILYCGQQIISIDRRILNEILLNGLLPGHNEISR